MTYRRALDVAGALLVDGFQQAGMNIVDAIDRVNGLGIKSTAAVASAPAAPPDNDASLTALMEQMKGL